MVYYDINRQMNFQALCHKMLRMSVRVPTYV